MPPASRGAPRPCRKAPTNASNRRSISLSTPRDPRNLPTRARARFNANDKPPSPTEPPPEGHVERAPTWRDRQRARFRYWTPRVLRDRPFLRSSLFSFVLTVPISAFLLAHFPFEPRRVTGPSMKPTINADCESEHDTGYSPTWVLVQKWGPNTYRDVQRRINEARAKGGNVVEKYTRGELVVYFTPHDGEKVALKRVVGLPGDVVCPLAGYGGSDAQEEVVVPYNHLWVEGDVNDRKKSVDSNYFGPISQALVRGVVVAQWSPWWNVLGMRAVKREGGEDSWPARRQGRVKENAVEEASADPNVVDSVKPYVGERGEKTLRWLREQPVAIEQRFITDEKYRGQMKDVWVRGMAVAKSHHDPETRDMAAEIVKEIQKVVGKDALKAAAMPGQVGKRWEPGEDYEAAIARYFKDVDAHEEERVNGRASRSSPAKMALKEMLEQKRQFGELVDKEFEDRDKVKAAREGL